MPRKTLFDDIFDALRLLPWWAGVTAAAVFALLGLFLRPHTDYAPIQPLLTAFSRIIFYGLSFASLIAAAVSAISSQRNRKLLDRQSDIHSLRALSWRDFEHLVGEAFRRQGYDVEETGGGGADGGIDLVLRGHGETVLVQCKQWRDRQVGVEKVRELFGVVTAERADRGILVTSGNFTNDAQSFKVGKPLTLVDGPALNDLVRAVQSTALPGQQPETQYREPPTLNPQSSTTVPSPACPRCGSPMVLRTAKRGASAGASFYGCTKYPACKGTRPLN